MSGAPAPLTPAEFARDIDVPRETLERLETYARLLREWQGRLNLVGASTLPDLWRRHMLDSAQILSHVPDWRGRPRRWLDLGSGAGFPAIVIAIMAGGEVHLVEKSPRKCEFLRAVAEATAAPVVIHQARAEDVTAPKIDILTARAFAPLNRLLGLAYPFFSRDTVAFFHKGQNLEEELTVATKCWKMRTTSCPSVTDSRGRILQVEKLAHA